MKVCFPVTADNGLESVVFNHFGSAPLFIMVDTETMEVSQLTNGDAGHSHGACSPIKALGGQAVDAVVAGGIGGGALSKLNEAGIRVYRAQAETIKDNVEILTAGSLREFSLLQTCSSHSHGHGHGCAH